MQKLQKIEKIKQIIKQYPRHYPKILKRKENVQLLNFINQETPLLKDSCYNISTKINWILNNRKDFPKCLMCNKIIGQFKNIKVHKQYEKHCSIKCASLDNNIKEKIKQTCLKKYGVDHPWKNENIKNKVYQTNLKKYGNKIASKSKIIKEKSQLTCLKKYGTKTSSQNQLIKEKAKQTCLKKYGVEYTTQTKQMQEKTKQTLLKKYGVDNCWKAEEIKEKIKQTCLKKYNVENYTKSQQYKIKSKLTNIKKYNYDNICKSPEYRKKYYQNLFKNPYVIPNFSFEIYFNTNKFNDNNLEWKCLECGNVFKSHALTSRYKINNITIPVICRKCHPYISGFSNEQKQLMQFCKQYYPNLIENDRTLIKPYELDITIPQIKLAIQFNGVYWHDLNHLQNNYHLNKTILCNQNGYRLLHIWQDQFIQNKDNIFEKLNKIFTNNQDLNFQQNIIKLDRSWYNNIDIKGYILQMIQQPEFINRNDYIVQNCGYLIYKRLIQK